MNHDMSLCLSSCSSMTPRPRVENQGDWRPFKALQLLQRCRCGLFQVGMNGHYCARLQAFYASAPTAFSHGRIHGEGTGFLETLLLKQIVRDVDTASCMRYATRTGNSQTMPEPFFVVTSFVSLRHAH